MSLPENVKYLAHTVHNEFIAIGALNTEKLFLLFL